MSTRWPVGRNGLSRSTASRPSVLNCDDQRNPSLAMDDRSTVPHQRARRGTRTSPNFIDYTARSQKSQWPKDYEFDGEARAERDARNTGGMGASVGLTK